MLKLDLHLPETVAAEYYQAADLLNQRFRDTNAKIDAKVLMAFALSRYDAEEVCGQFDLALRVVKSATPEVFNPALK